VAEDPLHPVNLCRHLGELLPPETIITTDVGQHQMWMAQAYPVRRPRTFLTSGGLGTMGFGLPAAIGAALAAADLHPPGSAGRRVVCVSGDGSVLMNIQELATLAELDLPVAVLVFNNDHLGLVRQQQELFYQRRFSASRFHAAPDFAAVARAFGLRAARLDPDGRDPLGDLAAALALPGPCLIDVPIPAAHNVLPMVPPAAPTTARSSPAPRRRWPMPDTTSAHPPASRCWNSGCATTRARCRTSPGSSPAAPSTSSRFPLRPASRRRRRDQHHAARRRRRSPPRAG
jgi:thiamine pyrophosphate-dependent acetolactate synthase large subunit-like protein